MKKFFFKQGYANNDILKGKEKMESGLQVQNLEQQIQKQN
jgi:hypothetical protein